MKIKTIYVNLPIKDIEKTRAFWTALGFEFNAQFSNESGLCLVLQENVIYAMLITHELFKTFTDRPIADGLSTQVLLAIEVDSRERVDEILEIAIQNGGKRYLKSEDHGWMYYDRFIDIDGHQWEVLYTDMSKLPQE